MTEFAHVGFAQMGLRHRALPSLSPPLIHAYGTSNTYGTSNRAITQPALPIFVIRGLCSQSHS